VWSRRESTQGKSQCKSPIMSAEYRLPLLAKTHPPCMQRSLSAIAERRVDGCIHAINSSNHVLLSFCVTTDVVILSGSYGRSYVSGLNMMQSDQHLLPAPHSITTSRKSLNLHWLAATRCYATFTQLQGCNFREICFLPSLLSLYFLSPFFPSPLTASK